MKTEINITWEFVEWAEKAVQEAFIKGCDDFGNDYEATGLMGDDEIQEIREVKLVKYNSPDNEKMLFSLYDMELGDKLKIANRLNKDLIEKLSVKTEAAKNWHRLSEERGLDLLTANKRVKQLENIPQIITENRHDSLANAITLSIMAGTIAILALCLYW